MKESKSSPMVVRVFVASPGDVAVERATVGRVVDSLSREFAQSGHPMENVTVEVKLWEEFFRPAAGRPEEQILNQLGSYDLLVAVFWTRAGTPTGWDSEGLEVQRSGTIEEVCDALRRNARERVPILIYQCTRPFFTADPDALNEFQDVCRFFREINSNRLALTRSYQQQEEFEKHLLNDLRQEIQELIGKKRVDNTVPVSTPMKDSPPPLPLGSLERSRLVEQIESALTSADHLCVLVGPSGCGKSALASNYFTQSKAAVKCWISCRGKLQKSAALLDFRDCELAVIDAFEDRHFCLTAIELLSKGCRVIVTASTVKCAELICRVRKADPTTSIVKVNALSIEEWTAHLRPLAGGNFVEIFNSLHMHLAGSVAALRLLTSIVEVEADGLPMLRRMRLAFAEQGELVEEYQRGELKSAPKIKPAPHLADTWRSQNPDAGEIMWTLAHVPMLGMSVGTLAMLLNRDRLAVEADVRMLEQRAFLYPLSYGRETLWAPMGYFRDAFEGIQLTYKDTRRLQQVRSRYIELCDSVLRNDVIGKIDSLFVRASRAFLLHDLTAIERELGECVVKLESLIAKQTLSHDAWIPITEAISRRAASCDQVISISQSLSSFESHVRLGDLAWRMTGGDDFWATTAAAYAAVRHWSEASCDKRSRVDLIRERIAQLEDSPRMQHELTMNPHADMFPAILIGGLGLMGEAQIARDYLKSSSLFRGRKTTFSHLVAIIQAADREEFELLSEMLRLHWSSVRGGAIKKFAAGYLRGVFGSCPELQVDSSDWRPKYDFRRTALQLAFSRQGLIFLEKELPFMRKPRFKDQLADTNILGQSEWFPAIGA